MDDATRFREARFDKPRHIKYWTRCLKSLLPHHYTGNESNRMYLAFFIISALDLLDAWGTVATDAERTDYINWIYHCQHPKGGFRMWPGTDFGDRANEDNAQWDPANIPATYFALSALLILGDDLQRVHRRSSLGWLTKMQRADGSFGETYVGEQVEGGSDPRFGYCAAGVRHILGGSQHQDVDIDAFVGCIRRGESYDGGIADEAFHEPHAGYTFCALGALSFFDRLNTESRSDVRHITAPNNPALTLRWLVTRQTDLDDPDEGFDSEFFRGAKMEKGEETTKVAATGSDPSAAEVIHQDVPNSSWCQEDRRPPNEAGMNGRVNKVADTCYAFWGGASFHVLGRPELYDQTLLKRYLLNKTQHPAIGGFGKFPGDLPDLYHSYMALAALGISGCEGVKEVDPTMCISKDASSRLSGLWKSWDLH